MDEISDERLEKLDRTLSEQIRLLERRLSRSAIPEDEWEFGPALEDAQLKLALVTELRDRRAAGGEAVAWPLGEALKYAETYSQEYEFDDGEGGYHSPTEVERMVMLDMINGLFSEAEFVSLIACSALHPSPDTNNEQGE